MRAIFRGCAKEYALNPQPASDRLFNDAHAFDGAQSTLARFAAVKGAAEAIDLRIVTPVNTPQPSCWLHFLWHLSAFLAGEIIPVSSSPRSE